MPGAHTTGPKETRHFPKGDKTAVHADTCSGAQGTGAHYGRGAGAAGVSCRRRRAGQRRCTPTKECYSAIKEKHQSEKATSCLTPTTWHSGKGKNYGESNRIGGRQGLRGRGMNGEHRFRSRETMVDTCHYTLSKPTDRTTTPRGRPHEKDGLQFVIMYHTGSSVVTSCNHRNRNPGETGGGSTRNCLYFLLNFLETKTAFNIFNTSNIFFKVTSLKSQTF